MWSIILNHFYKFASGVNAHSIWWELFSVSNILWKVDYSEILKMFACGWSSWIFFWNLQFYNTHRIWSELFLKEHFQVLDYLNHNRSFSIITPLRYFGLKYSRDAMSFWLSEGLRAVALLHSLWAFCVEFCMKVVYAVNSKLLWTFSSIN